MFIKYDVGIMKIFKIFYVIIFMMAGVNCAHAKIYDVRSLTGWYNKFQDDKKHLSPFLGFVWWETRYVEKMFRFGNVLTQKKARSAGGMRISAQEGNATILLLYELFQDVAGVLTPINEESHFAFYLTPRLIGTILDMLEDPFDLLTKEESNSRKSINRFKGQTLRDKFNNFLHNKDFPKNLEKSLQEFVWKCVETDVEKDKKIRGDVKASCNKFITLLVKALQESSDLVKSEEPKYLSKTPCHILTAFMYARANHTHDFFEYLNAFRTSPVKFEWQEKEFIEYTRKDLDNEFIGLASGERQAWLELKYEEIALSEIVEQFYAIDLQLGDEHPEIKLEQANGTFKACSEIAIYNLVRFILLKIGVYDTKNKQYDLENLTLRLQQWIDDKNAQGGNYSCDAEKCQKLSDHFQKNNPALNMDSDALFKWVKFVSNRADIKYSFANKAGEKFVGNPFVRIGDLSVEDKNRLGDESSYRILDEALGDDFLYELAGYPSMYINLLNDLLGLNCNNFQEICNLFELSIKNGDLNRFTDSAMQQSYEHGGPGITLVLESAIGKAKFTITVQASVGHATVTGQASGEYQASMQIFSYLLRGYQAFLSGIYDKGEAFSPFMMLFSSLPEMNPSFAPRTPSRAHTYYFWFLRNLLSIGGLGSALQSLYQAYDFNDVYRLIQCCEYIIEKEYTVGSDVSTICLQFLLKFYGFFQEIKYKGLFDKLYNYILHFSNDNSLFDSLWAFGNLPVDRLKDVAYIWNELWGKHHDIIILSKEDKDYPRKYNQKKQLDSRYKERFYNIVTKFITAVIFNDASFVLNLNVLDLFLDCVSKDLEQDRSLKLSIAKNVIQPFDKSLAQNLGQAYRDTEIFVVKNAEQITIEKERELYDHMFQRVDSVAHMIAAFSLLEQQNNRLEVVLTKTYLFSNLDEQAIKNNQLYWESFIRNIRRFLDEARDYHTLFSFSFLSICFPEYDRSKNIQHALGCDSSNPDDVEKGNKIFDDFNDIGDLIRSLSKDEDDEHAV